MNQRKIGEFIANRRKALKLTQKQLAERLEISDKTISKWETGKGLPEVSLMLPLCTCLGINVNELLSSVQLSGENYRKKAEENIMDLVKEREENKKKIILVIIIAMTCIIAGTTIILVTGLIEMATNIRIILIIIATAIVIVGIVVACVLEQDAGAYECPQCHERFVPSMNEYIKGPHTLTKRYLKCHKCGESNFCRHQLTK